MKLDLSKPVTTRDGRKVTILSQNGKEPFHLVGYIGTDSHPSCWTRHGKYNVAPFETSRDLINPPVVQKHTLWANIYPSTEDTTVYVSRQRADEHAARYGRIACVPVTIKFTEGEGL